MTDFDLNGRFCPKPFEFLEINEKKQAFCCCPGWLPKSLGDFDKNDPLNIWNSEIAQKIRASILDGTFEYCLKNECQYIGNNTLPMASEIKDEFLLNIIDKKITKLENKPRILELSYDRSCNLSCPSCRTSMVVIDSQEYKDKQSLQKSLLEGTLEHLTSLIITGSGDPFVSKLFRELLESLDSNKYPNLSIHLMTNGQLFTSVNWEKWSKSYKAIKSVQISIDAATEKTYQLLRRGGDFNNLINNLKFIKNLKEEKKINSVSIDFVVQVTNYKEMKSFVNIGKNHGFDRVGFSSIRNWQTFSSEEYINHAIHLPNHPQHKYLLNHLCDPIFQDPIVDLGNIMHLKQC